MRSIPQLSSMKENVRAGGKNSKFAVFIRVCIFRSERRWRDGRANRLSLAPTLERREMAHSRPRSEGRLTSSNDAAKLNARTGLSRSVGAEYDDFQEDEIEEEDEEVDTTPPVAQPLPRRPSDRSAAARVQRFVLAGPGQKTAKNTSTKKADVFMTNLPDSPPKHSGKGTIFKFSDTSSSLRALSPPQESQATSRPNSGQPQRIEDVTSAPRDTAYVLEPDESDTSEDDQDKPSEDTAVEQRPEVDESQEETLTPSGDGPHAIDLLPSDHSDSDFDEEEQRDDDEEDFRQIQEARARFEAEQNERDRLREDLEGYVKSLAKKEDEAGEKLVEFPKNFQQIVSLMTARDLEAETNGKGKHAAAKDGEKQPKSWSQILIQNSLSKQQAHGMLDESEDGPDGESSLSSKIALKMARIRQLDTVLEEKLGKNLYATQVTTTKKAKRINPQEPEVLVRKGPSAAATIRSSAPPPSVQTAVTTGGAMNFIERNRKVIENGAKANLTREEEQRLRRLMRETDKAATTNDGSALVTEEFQLSQHEKDTIEKMIAERRGMYQSAVIMALDDVPEEDAEEELREKKEKRKPNVVQETKRERLRKQRLQRIEEELRFLQENESVPILPDEDDDASDGCISERSYKTTSSMFSTASTRSGVTRRQLDHFVATEVTKPENVGEKASSDEIQRLLRSLSHLSITTPRPATTSV